MAQVKRMRSVANGNRTFITDFTSIANALFSAIAGLPFANNNFCISRAVVNGGSAPSITINRYGGVFMRNKFFGTADDGVLSIPKGWYLYAVGELDTTQPRTSTTGASYSQNYVYYLVASQTAQTGLATDYDALTGKWEIINGATTGAMTDDTYATWAKDFIAPWGWSAISGSIPANSVDTAALMARCVTGAKIALRTILHENLADSCVSANNITASGVSEGNLADNCVSPSKMKQGTILYYNERIINLSSTTVDLEWGDSLTISSSGDGGVVVLNLPAPEYRYYGNHIPVIIMGNAIGTASSIRISNSTIPIPANYKGGVINIYSTAAGWTFTKSDYPL